MSHEEREELKSCLSSIISSKFTDPRVRRANFASRENVTFYYLDWDSHLLIIKRYHNKDYFDRELFALEALAGTDRVCPVLFHSRLLDEYWQENFNGPYLVVKPYYSGFLRNETGKSPLLLIERAAQEVNISEQLFRYGWRDLDGNINNDAVLLDGRLIRFDLDGAQPRWASADKYNPPYLASGDAQACEAIVAAQRTLFQEEAELESVAIRISQLLLAGVDVRQWPLKDQVLSLRRRNSRNALFRLFFGEGHKKRDAHRLQLQEEWLRTWEGRLSPDAEVKLQSLTKPEARLLGYLFFHLLSRADHGFRLRDLYMSLMLLDIGALIFRYPDLVIPGQRTRNSDQFGNLIEDLYELRKFTEEPATEVPTSVEPTPAPPAPDLFELQLSSDGREWGASRKGTGRECEDLVLLPSSAERPLLLLADGASLANGLQAVQMAKAIFTRWELGFKFGTPSENRSAIETLITSIHQELFSNFRRDNKLRETTIVIVMVVNDPKNPYAMIVRYGNSGFLVTHESEDGYINYKLRSSSTPPSKSLGAIDLDWKRSEPIMQVPLKQEGIYRIRAWSDGVADKEEEAEQLVDRKMSIGELVAEARDWASTHHAIGDDDWAIAGFDIQVSKKKAAVREQDGPSTGMSRNDKATASDPFGILRRVAQQKFSFSNEAIAFWRNLLQKDETLKALLEYPIIQYVLNRHPAPPPPPKTTEMMTVHVPESTTGQGQRQKSARNSRFLPIAVTIAVVLVLIVRYCVQSSSNVDQKSVSSNSSSTVNATPSSSPKYTFENLRAQAIYEKLESEDRFPLDHLPKNSEIDTEPLKTFLDDLTEVLGKTRMRVLVEVYTDLSGGTEVNLQTSNERANKIKNKLLATGRVSEVQIQVIGRGEIPPVVLNEQTEEDRNKNRRLVVVKRPIG